MISVVQIALRELGHALEVRHVLKISLGNARLHSLVVLCAAEPRLTLSASSSALDVALITVLLCKELVVVVKLASSNMADDRLSFLV